MQDNDFEKQVYQKMGELRFLPSETVWEQVERRLHRKEKRRGWIIWFPLLLSGLSWQVTLPYARGNYYTQLKYQQPLKKYSKSF